MSTIDTYCEICGAKNNGIDEDCFACGHKLGSVVENEDEQLLRGRYRLLYKIGEGGFSVVYKASDTRTLQNVAIKVVTLKGLSVSEKIEATDTFNREVGLLSVLQHRNLPRLHEHFSDAECWYVVMDFIDGETLEDYLDKQPEQKVSLLEALDVGLLLCDVLLYLHSQNPPIIFRDLKPSNIMLTRDGHLFLLDFGIARRYKPGKEKDTIPFGSKGYAAPEQYGRAQTSAQADIYSLGAIMHELVTGTDPSLAPLTFAPLDQSVPALKELNALLMRMVELDAHKRPVSVDEVRQALQRIGEIARLEGGLAPVTVGAGTWRPAMTYTLYKRGNTGNLQNPYGGQVGYGQTQQYYPPPQPPLPRNNLAFAALICSSIGAFLPFYTLLCSFGSFQVSAMTFVFMVPSLLGIVFGILGMRRAPVLHASQPGYKTGRNAIILGGVFMGLYIISIIILLLP